MSEIFIAYSRKDIELVRQIFRALRDLDYNVFFDQELKVSDRWRKRLQQEAREAGCVIAMWSKDSYDNEWVIAEANIGKSQDKLISIMLDRTPPPFPFNSEQAAVLSDWDNKNYCANWEKF